MKKSESSKTRTPKTKSSKTKTPKAKTPKAKSTKAESTKAKSTKAKSTKTRSPSADSPSQLIDARIKELADWRGQMLGRLRSIVKKADPVVVEEWKWNIPVWSHDGL